MTYAAYYDCSGVGDSFESPLLLLAWLAVGAISVRALADQAEFRLQTTMPWVQGIQPFQVCRSLRLEGLGSGASVPGICIDPGVSSLSGSIIRKSNQCDCNCFPH